MSIEWPRQDGESDDSYFMRVFRAARVEYPELTLAELYLGTCIETRLECLHPVDVREHHGLQGVVLARDYLAGEPPSRLKDRDYLKRFNSWTFCPVCQTFGPVEPVDICKRREQQLATIFHAASEDDPC